jgi:hypothetical protein
MQNNDRLERLHQQIDDALTEYEQVRSHVDSLGESVGAGDVFRFSAASLECVALFRHPDEPALWYVVPADQNPSVGTADVEVRRSNQSGPMTLRCGRGTWVPDDAFDFDKRTGQIIITDVELAREKLSRIVRGGLTPSHEQQELDWDPDYQRWLDEVAQAVETLETSLEATEPLADVRIRLSDFSPNWHSQLKSSVKMPPALAAESGDLLAQAAADHQPAEGAIVGLDLPGELVALNYPDGIRLQYFPGDQETGSHPKVVWTDSDGNPVAVTWQPAPTGMMHSNLVPWTDQTSGFEVDGLRVTIEE